MQPDPHDSLSRMTKGHHVYVDFIKRKCLAAYMKCANIDLGRLRSLIRVLYCCYILHYPVTLKADRGDHDQTAHRSLIWVFAVLIYVEDTFLHGSLYVERFYMIRSM